MGRKLEMVVHLVRIPPGHLQAAAGPKALPHVSQRMLATLILPEIKELGSGQVWFRESRYALVGLLSNRYRRHEYEIEHGRTIHAALATCRYVIFSVVSNGSTTGSLVACEGLYLQIFSSSLRLR